MFRFDTSVYSTVGTKYELKTQFSLHPYFQHAAVCFQSNTQMPIPENK